MKSTVVSTFACVLSLPVICVGQVDPPETMVFESSCPSEIISSFPQGNGETICVWTAVDCMAGSSATMYGSCDGSACSCVGSACSCADQMVLEPGGIEVIENDPPDSTPPGPAPGPGVPEAALNSSGLPVAQQNANVRFQILTGLTTVNQPPARRKIFVGNKKDLKRTTPVASKLVPNQADELTTFGRNGNTAKYLKCLKLKVGSTDEYFALFKIFKDDMANPNGDQDLETDQYVGLRISEPSKLPPGGYVQLNSNAAGRVKKLGKFDGANNYVREVGVRIPVKRATSGSPMTWFHLFGTVM